MFVLRGSDQVDESSSASSSRSSSSSSASKLGTAPLLSLLATDNTHALVTTSMAFLRHHRGAQPPSLFLLCADHSNNSVGVWILAERPPDSTSVESAPSNSGGSSRLPAVFLRNAERKNTTHDLKKENAWMLPFGEDDQVYSVLVNRCSAQEREVAVVISSRGSVSLLRLLDDGDAEFSEMARDSAGIGGGVLDLDIFSGSPRLLSSLLLEKGGAFQVARE